MTTVLLVRHGRTGANAGGVLAGWTEGVGLDDAGRAQAGELARRLAGVRLSALVTSPLQRCQETTEQILAARPSRRRPPVRVDARLGECRYGDWTGRAIKDLARDPLWRVVQAHPSAVTFPGEGGESLRGMQARAVEAVRAWNAQLGARTLYTVVSHGDVIKAILADALGLHLDQFQRLVVDPCSVSVVTYTELRPFVVRINDTGGDLSTLQPPRAARGRRASDAVVGGGPGVDRAGGVGDPSPA